ncbi:MAG: hypothetical protein HY763_17155, partial [Planctomycetes bacterium]|nr:hypothetical protein [Planctomycetota bacterium]
MRRRVLDADGAGSGGTTIVSHANDAAGNLVLSAAHFFTYDPWNRAVEVREKGTLAVNGDGTLTGAPGALVTRIEYDALGRRIAESISSDVNAGPSDYFYYDGNRVIEHATAPSGNPPPPPPPQEYSLRLDPAPHDVGTADPARDAVMHASADDRDGPPGAADETLSGGADETPSAFRIPHSALVRVAPRFGGGGVDSPDRVAPRIGGGGVDSPDRGAHRFGGGVGDSVDT